MPLISRSPINRFKIAVLETLLKFPVSDIFLAIKKAFCNFDFLSKKLINENFATLTGLL